MASGAGALLARIARRLGGSGRARRRQRPATGIEGRPRRQEATTAQHPTITNRPCGGGRDRGAAGGRGTRAGRAAGGGTRARATGAGAGLEAVEGNEERKERVEG